MSCISDTKHNEGQNKKQEENNKKKRKETSWWWWKREKLIKDEYVRKFLKTCSFCSTGLSSLLGAAAARKAGMSPVGCVVLSFVSGMGGGTLRRFF